jgi:hypothetical protein
MVSSGKGTRTIDVGRFKTNKVRTKGDNWGRKRCQSPNSRQQLLSNGCAKIITGGPQEVSLEGMSDQKLSCLKREPSALLVLI